MPEQGVFTVGGTVQAGGGLYLSRPVDDDLLTACQNGEFSFVLTARQMGKSSLMVRTAERLRDEGVRSVIIDLSQVGVQVTPDEWYLGILTAIEEALDLETDIYDWWEDNDQVGLAQRLTLFLHEVALTEVTGNVVLFFDEIDSTLSLDFTDDFFASIRYIHNARAHIPAYKRLSIVLIGVATPSDLINDAKRTPFNIGQRIDLKYFTEDDAQPLAAGFGLSYEENRRRMNWVLKWTGGHPYLTQRLARALASSNGTVVSEKDVDTMVAGMFFGERAEQDSNLRFVHDMLTRRAPDELGVLSMYGDVLAGRRVPDRKQSRIVTHLKLSGIIRGDAGGLVIQNAIYRRVFDKHWLKRQWPEHWIKRVPPAVIGLVAASFLAVVFLGLVFFQNRQRVQAERYGTDMAALNEQVVAQRDRTEVANNRLADELLVSDSLRVFAEDANLELGTQIRVTDSLRTEEARLNRDLVAQVDISDSLRSLEQAANEQLSEQIGISDSLRTIAEERLEIARVARLETISIGLASKAQRLVKLGDPALAGLLARQAYLFGQRGGGEDYLDPVYDALRQSLNAMDGPQETLGGPHVLAEHRGPVRDVQCSPGCEWIVSAAEDGQIGLAPGWATDRTATRYLDAHRGGTRALGFLVDPVRLLSAGEDGRVLLWNDLETASPSRDQIGLHTGGAWALDVSNDNQMVASAGANGRVLLYDVSDQDFTVSAEYEVDGRVLDLAFVSGKSLLGIGLENGLLQLWDYDSGETQTIETGHRRILSVSSSPDGSLVATAGSDQTARLWSFGSPVLQNESIELTGHEGPVNAVAFSPRGDAIATASADNSIQLWPLSGGGIGAPVLLQQHTSWVWSIAFAPEGDRLISSSADRSVLIWRIRADQLATDVCSVVGDRSLTAEDWAQYVGGDFDFETEYVGCPASKPLSVESFTSE